MPTAISVRNAVKKYNDIIALDNVSINIESGEILSILGPNGAGKTTLLRAISGTLRLDSGDIIVKNYNVNNIRERVKQIVGYVPELNMSFPELTVEQNIRFSIDLHGGKEPFNSDWIYWLIESLGINTVLDRKAGSLSKGWRRRLDIIMGIVHSPEIILLDEPGGGLDPSTRIILRRIISELNKKFDKTIVIATHNISDAILNSSRIALMNMGRIILVEKPTKIRRMLAGRTTKLTVLLSPPSVSTKVAEFLIEKGIKAVSAAAGEVIMTATLWRALESVVEAAKLFNVTVEDFVISDLYWEELFRSLIKNSREQQGEACACKQ